jgi:hypothetical protein
MRDDCGSSLGFTEDMEPVINVWMPEDLSGLRAELEAAAGGFPVAYGEHNGRREDYPDKPVDEVSFEDDEDDDTVPEFVFGCVAASDGIQAVLISVASDWREHKRMTDTYSDAAQDAIDNAFDACGIEAAELEESTYELISMTADEARVALAQAAGFTHDASFETTLSW